MAKSAQIKKVSIKHEEIMNFMLANPILPVGEVAAHFGVTFPWLSTIIHSDAFQDRLKKKQEELFDCAVLQTVPEKVEAATQVTLDAYLEKVPTLTADQLISAQDKLLNRLGYGTKNGNGLTIGANSQVNVQMNQVSGDILKEARDRIGKNQVGQADSPPALQDNSGEGFEASAGPVEIEGASVREESS